MNLFPYNPTPLIPMHPHHHQQASMFAREHHHHHHHHHHHQQQQQANLLYYQYNQLRSMQATFSNPTLPSMQFEPIHQSQQAYRTDQMVPSASPQGVVSVQQSSPTQNRLQRSSPSQMPSIQLTDHWSNANSLQNPEVFRSVLRTISNSRLDAINYSNRNSNTTSPTLVSPGHVPYGSPSLTHHRHKKQVLSPKSQDRRQRLHSGSSCYESDSPLLSTDDEEEFQLRPVKSNHLSVMPPTSKKRAHSALGRSEPSVNDSNTHEIYQTSINSNGVFPSINPTAISQGHPHPTSKTSNIVTRPKLLQYIEENIIGNDTLFQGPWGVRRMIYCDYTASGRPVQFIENYIKNHVLPLYGNTHSETSLCAQQSTKFREEARNIIKKSVNATDDDILLFTGTGSTGSVHTMVDNLDLHNEEIRNNTVVIVSAFEHHSNILPWQETGVEMIRLPTTQQGILDKEVLKEKLIHYSSLDKRIICSLNAASNISGILTDVDTVSTLVHSYGGLIFWDYATAAPYVNIDMNPAGLAYKDAIFISTHKFIGGPGTPGLLIAKKHLFSLKAPKACGGGTVNFVTRTCREYNYNIEIREEGGTPDIIGCIRAGLVFQLKDAIDMNYTKVREDELVKRFYRRFKKHETLILLGSTTAERLPIFSFIIYVPGVCKYLHHNFICLLLNDLFGIQVRSGCACAGPYALDLLNVDDAKTDIYCMFMTEDECARENPENAKIVRTMMMKPGFTRLNLPFFTNDDDIEYILNAIEFVAVEGWKFLPMYTYEPVTGGWAHRSGFQLAQSSLEDITYKSGKMQYLSGKRDSFIGRTEKLQQDPFREARIIAGDAVRLAMSSIDYTSDPPLNVPDAYKHMVWFALPIDIALMMVKQKETGQEILCQIDSIPFIPDEAKERLTNTVKISELSNGVGGSEISHVRKKHNSKRVPSTSRNR